MKVSIKSASRDDRNEFDLSSRHITTSDFGQIQPTYIIESVPGDKIHANPSLYVRCTPLAVPTFGNIKVISRAFFVPMRSIFNQWDAFYSRSVDTSLPYNIPPTISNRDFISYFRGIAYTAEPATPLSTDLLTLVDKGAQAYDIRFQPLSGMARQYYRYTAKGRLYMKILQSLGYSINWDNSDTTAMSALPLLAFLRCLYDYIYPSQYLQQQGLRFLFEENDDRITSDSILDALGQLLFLPYSQDYFTAAWKSPNQVASSQFYNWSQNANNGGVSLSQGSNNVFSSSNDTFIGNGLGTASSSPLTAVSAYALRLMQATADFMTRNNIVGSRYVEQMAARFGIKSPQVDPNRSRYIGSNATNIRIEDVTSFAETDKASLGDLGAKAYAVDNDQKSFDFTNDNDFGYFIVISHISPDTFYFQGRKRHTLHLNNLQFYLPEYDSVGMQAIRNDELYSEFNDSDAYLAATSFGGRPDGVYGFAPRLIEYKKRDDYLTGDFRVPSSNVGMDSYHLGRVLPQPSRFYPLALNSEFLGQKQYEYDRIFQQVSQPNSSFSFSQAGNDNTPYLFYGNKVACFYLGVKDTINGSNYDGVMLLMSSINDGRVYGLFRWLSADGFITIGGVLYEAQVIRNVAGGSDNVPYNDYLTSASVGLTEFTLSSDDGGFSLSFSIYDPVRQEVAKIENFCPNANNGYSFSSNISYPSLGEGSDVLTTSLFADLSQEYFDHFIMHYQYDVKAYRKMLSISESIPLFDKSGSTESVDMNGVHLTT